MTESQEDWEEVRTQELREMDDEELAEAYTSIVKAAGFLSNSLDRIIKKRDELEQTDDVSDVVMEKARENAEDAEDRKEHLDDLLQSVKDEVNERGIDPYEVQNS